jgi:hypothetical protein
LDRRRLDQAHSEFLSALAPNGQRLWSSNLQLWNVVTMCCGLERLFVATSGDWTDDVFVFAFDGTFQFRFTVSRAVAMCCIADELFVLSFGRLVTVTVYAAQDGTELRTLDVDGQEDCDSKAPTVSVQMVANAQGLCILWTHHDCQHASPFVRVRPDGKLVEKHLIPRNVLRLVPGDPPLFLRRVPKIPVKNVLDGCTPCLHPSF